MAISLLLLLLSLAACTAKPSVRITNGIVTGEEVVIGLEKVQQFLSIPFAEPPIGSLRFARPEPLQRNWTTPLAANYSSNRCLQPYPPVLKYYFPDTMFGETNEDCLYLNVWTPLNVTGLSLPVMFWIYGGGFTSGEAYPTYDGRAICAQGNVVVVTTNYRVGPFGFWSAEPGKEGNWGLWDQQLALKWVHANIANFGGDPNLVTIFGESAGAASVSAHLLNAESRRLFRRAILQSGSILAHWAYTPKAKEMQKQYHRFANTLGCPKGGHSSVILACMRSMNSSAIVRLAANYHSYNFMPIVDASFFGKSPEVLLQSMNETKEVMMGLNTDEGGSLTMTAVSYFVPKNTTPTPSLMAPIIFTAYPWTPLPVRKEVLDAIISYVTSWANPNNFVSNIIELNKGVSQSMMICPITKEADAYAKINNDTSVFAYEFAHRPSGSRYPAYVGATHADEIPFVFNWNELYPGKMNVTAEEVNLTRTIIEEWTHFAHHGRPASADWGPYNRAQKEYRRLSANPTTKQFFYRRDECVFWDKLLPKINAMSVALAAAKATSRPPSCPSIAPCAAFGQTATIVSAILGSALAVAMVIIIALCVSRYRGSSSKSGLVL